MPLLTVPITFPVRKVVSTKTHGVSGPQRVQDSVEFATCRIDLLEGCSRATLDCLHNMADPTGAALHIRQMLKPDGAWMIVEPFANDAPEENLNPIGRVFYAASTLICVPASQSGNGPALGAQAGETRLGMIVREGRFTRFRRATQTPFNLVLEARP